MADKAKILAEIDRLRKNLPWGGSAAQLSFECNCKNEAYTEIEKFINSLPEERPYKTGERVWYLNELYTLEDDGKHYILTSVRDNVTASVVHLDYGCEDFKLLPYEEPVSKVWHDVEENPDENRDFAFVDYDGVMWSRYRIEDLCHDWQSYVNMTGMTKWAYTSDLIKL